MTAASGSLKGGKTVIAKMNSLNYTRNHEKRRLGS
jgi:hypothetical protein